MTPDKDNLSAAPERTPNETGLSRRTFVKVSAVGALTLIGAGLVGCGSSSTLTDKSFDGLTLTFVQNVSDDSKTKKLTEQIIKRYEKATGLKVDYTNQTSGYRDWVVAQFDSGSGPDVYMGALEDLIADYGAGRLYNLASVFSQESPYDTGQFWRDTLPAAVQGKLYLTPDEVVGYATSSSMVRLFYNKTLLDSLGLAAPEIWTDLLAACAALNSAGVTPLALGMASRTDRGWSWLGNSIVSQLNSAINATLDVSANGFVSLAEMARGVFGDQLNMRTAEVEQAFDLMKDLAQYWDQGYATLSQSTAVDRFTAGSAAMVLAPVDQAASISETVGKDFTVGLMPVPAITTTTATTVLGQSVVAGGDPAIIYGINADLSSNATRLEAAIDFVQYLSSASVQAEFFNEILRPPSNTKVDLGDDQRGYLITEEPLRLDYFTGLDEEFDEDFRRGTLTFLQGRYTSDTFANYVDSIYYFALQRAAARNGWTVDNGYGTGVGMPETGGDAGGDEEEE